MQSLLIARERVGRVSARWWRYFRGDHRLLVAAQRPPWADVVWDMGVDPSSLAITCEMMDRDVRHPVQCGRTQVGGIAWQEDCSGIWKVAFRRAQTTWNLAERPSNQNLCNTKHRAQLQSHQNDGRRYNYWRFTQDIRISQTEGRVRTMRIDSA